MGDTALTIINQIVVMFLLMFAGHLLYKKKILDDGGTRQLSALLLNIVTPAVLITSYQRPFDKKEALSLNCPILCGQYKKAPWQEILSF